MVPWVTQNYQHKSLNVSPCRTVNWYVENVAQPESKSQSILMPTPATVLSWDLSNISVGAIRGTHFTSTSRFFVVAGGSLIELPNPNGSSGFSSPVERMTVSDVGLMSITDNGKYLVMADGFSLLLYNLDTDVSATPTYTFTNPSFVEYIDNKVVATNGSNQFYWCELGEDGPLIWPALNVASAELSADNIISMGIKDGELWLFGDRSFEVWRIGTNPNLPFNRVGGTGTEIGCGAPYSVATIGGQIFWLGSSNAGKDQVFVSNGYGAQEVSNPTIQHLISSSADYSTSSVGFAYQQNSHTFYVLNLIDANKTIVFDTTTGAWHERATRDPDNNILNRWVGLYASYAFGKVYVGHSNEPKILELDLDAYEEYDGRAIVRIHQGPVLWKNLTNVVHSEFLVDMETGVGLQNGQGSDPQAMLQYSDDSGHTWSSEMWTDIGEVGKYATRVSWRRLGASRNRVYRLTISDPVKPVIIAGRAVVSRASKR